MVVLRILVSYVENSLQYGVYQACGPTLIDTMPDRSKYVQSDRPRHLTTVNSAVAQSHAQYEYDEAFTRRRVDDVSDRNCQAIFCAF